MIDSDLHRPLYVPDILVNALATDPDRPVLQLLDGPLVTVREIRDETSRYVEALRTLGIGAGMRVSMIAPNRPEVLYAHHALQLLGAISVPMHPLAGLSDHAHIVADAGAEALIFDPDRYGERAEGLKQAKPGLRLISFGAKDGADDVIALAATMEARPLIAPRVGPHDPVRMGYSGGTTGNPKALVSVQRTSPATLQIMLAEWEWPASPRVLCCTPLSHSGAALFLPTLLKQGNMLVLPGFDVAAVLSAIETYRINCMMLVPTMIYAILDHPDLEKYDLSSLETIFYGASSISPPRLKEAIERIGPVFSQFYGQAEAPMAITLLRKAEHDANDLKRLSSCGRPLPWIDIELRDADGRRVDQGEPGEICVRGPLVMDGYRDQPDLTAETLRDGWLHTGDVAVQDEQGFLYIVDRTKDMIVSGGFNIYPREIEDILATHPAVAEVAVIGVPHEKWGEAVKALIVLRAGHTVEPDELIALVADRKGRFQAPKIVEFIDAIPLTPLGKPDKKALRAREA